MNKQTQRLLRRNLLFARKKWVGELENQHLEALKSLSEEYGFILGLGDLLILDGKWYVTHAGLLRLAQRRRCVGITTSLQRHLSDSAANRWVPYALRRARLTARVSATRISAPLTSEETFEGSASP